MNAETVKLLVPVISGLAALVFDLVRNWQNANYKPVVPDDLQKAIDKLQALKDLPE